MNQHAHQEQKLPWWWHIARFGWWSRGAGLPAIEDGERIIWRINGYLGASPDCQLVLTNLRLIQAYPFQGWTGLRISFKRKRKEIWLTDIGSVSSVTSGGRFVGPLGIGRIEIAMNNGDTEELRTRKADIVSSVLTAAIENARRERP